MFKKISSIFGSKDTRQDSSTSREDEIRKLYRVAQGELDNFHRTVDIVVNEVDFIPEESRLAVAQLVDVCKSELWKFEKEWNGVHQQQSASKETLQAFITRIKIAKEKLSPLKQRKIYRGNLDTLGKQLALQQLTLSKGELETTLRPQIDAQLESIATLEGKKHLDVNEQRILALHQSNLRIYQEMLSGQRPYAPLRLINEIASQEQAIEDIDNRLA